jgi:hypothetical protein
LDFFAALSTQQQSREFAISSAGANGLHGDSNVYWPAWYYPRFSDQRLAFIARGCPTLTWINTIPPPIRDQVSPKKTRQGVSRLPELLKKPLRLV